MRVYRLQKSLFVSYLCCGVNEGGADFGNPQEDKGVFPFSIARFHVSFAPGSTLTFVFAT